MNKFQMLEEFYQSRNILEEVKDELWDPTTDEEVVLYMDSLDPSTMDFFTDGETVVRWRDKSLSSLEFISAPGDGPVWDGEKIVARFGDDFNPIVGNTLGIDSTNVQFTLVSLVQPVVGAVRRIFTLGSTTPRVLVSDSNTETGFRYGNGNVIFTPENGSERITSFSKSGNQYINASARRNGTPISITTSAAGSSVADNFSVDSYKLWDGSWEGNIWCYLVLKSTSLDLIEKAEGYIAHRFNKLNLLSPLHPYKSSPPIK